MVDSKSWEQQDNLDRLLRVLLLFAPVFFLTVKGWMSTILLLSSLVALLQVCRKGFCVKNLNRAQVTASYCLIFALIFGFLSQLGMQFIQGQFIPRNLDAPSRLLLSAALFAYLLMSPVSLFEKSLMALSGCLLITLMVVLVYPQSSLAWGDRAATYFADPNNLGSYVTAIACLLFYKTFADLNERSSLKVLMGLSSIAGFYLSYYAKTRGAWIAGTTTLLSYVFFMSSAPLSRRLGILLALLGTLGFFFVASSGFSGRVLDGVTEFTQFFDGSNRETSAGYRLSMFEISLKALLQKPWTGHGDFSKVVISSLDLDPALYSPIVIEMFSSIGPHNELLANAVRYGISGIAATLLVFLVPIGLFIFISMRSVGSKTLPACGFIFCCVMFISSQSLEVLTLKYAVSFYGFFVAVFAAESLKNMVKTSSAS